jgi:hypothetical protein
MLPAFIFVIGMYCYTLANLLMAPYYEKIEVPLLAWWLMTHIYVMNRIIFAVLARFSLLVESRYARNPPCARPSLSRPTRSRRRGPCKMAGGDQLHLLARLGARR